MRGAWRRTLAWERGDSGTDPANLLGIHLPCTPLATCDLLGFADALCSALTACNFFLFRQEKVTKKKATPALRGRLCRLPSATRVAGRQAQTRGFAPQTVLADCPRPPSVARRCTRGRNNTPNGIDTDGGGYRCGFHLALCVVEQRKAQREKGRGLSEDRRSEFRSPPLRLSSAEHPARAGRRGGRAFFLATSSWQDKKKYARASGAEPRRRSPSWHKEPAR